MRWCIQAKAQALLKHTLTTQKEMFNEMIPLLKQAASESAES